MNADRFVVTDALIHRYSRRGNFHTDAAQSEQLGLPGLVAQGTQATGRAYSQLLDTWGEAFLAHGTLDLKFVGMVVGGDEIETRISFDGHDRDVPDRDVPDHDASGHDDDGTGYDGTGYDGTVRAATIEVDNISREHASVRGTAGAPTRFGHRR